MRSSRGQNPPSPGNEPESQGAPEAEEARDKAPRREEAPSWFAPLPPAETPRPERSRGASGEVYRPPAPDAPRSRPAPDDFDPDDLYPPEYRVSGRGDPFRTDSLPRPPSVRDPGPPARGRTPSRDERRAPANRDAYDRPPRERDPGDRRPEARPDWYREAAPAEPPISERFGYRSPEDRRERPAVPSPRNPPLSAYWEEREEQRKLEESGQIPRISPPGEGAYNPYASGVWPASPPADRPPAGPSAGPSVRAAGDVPFSPYSGQFTMPPMERVGDTTPQAIRTSGQFAYPRPGESDGAFRPASAGAASNGADLHTPPVTLTRSGRLATTGRPGTSGAFAAVPVAPPRPAPAVVRAPRRSLLTDPVVLSFLGLGLLITGAMVAFVALRYSTFPQQITLHFGPAGASQRDRIGDRQELWTIPFISGIVFVANSTLAFVFDFFDRQDRFVPRLLAIGSALVSLVAWVVLLTLLYR